MALLPNIAQKQERSGDYRLVSTLEELEAVRQELEAADVIAVDTETEGVEYEAIIVGICLSTKPGTGYYIPMRHIEFEGVLYEGQLPPPVVYDAIGPALETKICVGHNTKFDQQMLWKDGIDCNFVHDTLAFAKLYIDSKKNGLKFLVGKYFGHEMMELESLFPKRGNKKPEIRPAILSPEQIRDYAVEDANWTLQLLHHLIKIVPGAAESSLYGLEMKLIDVVGEMEAFGLPVSKEFLIEQGSICQSHIKRLEQEILQDVRDRLQDPEYEMSLGSNKDLARLLFEHLKMPIGKRSEKTGDPSVDKEVLEDLAKLDPLTRRIHVYRTMGKLNSTYLAGLVPKVHDDGRIRGSFNQFGTDTGRFSSSRPNLQNLPRTQTFFLWEADNPEIVNEFLDPEHFRLYKTEDGEACYEFYSKAKGEWVRTAAEIAIAPNGKPTLACASDGKTYGIEDGVFKEVWRCKTRNFVEAKPGHYLIEADYSQIEVRILAGESGERTLIEAYANREDVHAATAAMVLDVAVEDLTDDQRQIGKTLNFSLLYGQGAESTAVQLGITKDEAQALIARYFERLTNIRDWINQTKQSAVTTGYGKTTLGRIRRFPEINCGVKWIMAKQQREAVNFQIQGAAADVMKLALVRTDTRLRQHFGDKAKMVSTVHDSVMLEVSDEIAIEDLMAVLKESMTGFNDAFFTKGWPDLVIDVKKGPAWADAKEVPWPEQTVPLPSDYEGELPKVRVRKIAHEREQGLTSSPTANKTEQVDIFTGLLTLKEMEPQHDGAWTIEFPKKLTQVQFSAFTAFLQSRSEKTLGSESGNQFSALKVVMPGDGDEATVTELKGRFSVTMRDEMQLRIKVGSCILRQELEDIDPDEVLRGIDFNL